MSKTVSDTAADSVEHTLKCLKSGGVLLYPTDTIYGLGCDATRVEACERIYQIKARDPRNPVLLLAPDVATVESMFNISALQGALPKLWPGPNTLVLKNIWDDLRHLENPEGKLAVRVARDRFLEALFAEWKGFLVSTSANLSGQPYSHAWGDLRNQFATSVDLLVERNPYPLSPPSRVMEWTGTEWKVLRGEPFSG